MRLGALCGRKEKVCPLSFLRVQGSKIRAGQMSPLEMLCPPSPSMAPTITHNLKYVQQRGIVQLNSTSIEVRQVLLLLFFSVFPYQMREQGEVECTTGRGEFSPYIHLSSALICQVFSTFITKLKFLYPSLCFKCFNIPICITEVCIFLIV